MMGQNTKDKEEKIYAAIMNLKKGNDSDKSLAFECIGILGNESTEESFENRLNIVEELIKKHFEINKEIQKK